MKEIIPMHNKLISVYRYIKLKDKNKQKIKH